MTKTIEYCVIPRDHWMVVRFESETDGNRDNGGSTQRGEFQNEDEANSVAVLLAKAEGAKIRRSSRKSLQGLARDTGIGVAEI